MGGILGLGSSYRGHSVCQFVSHEQIDLNGVEGGW